MKLLSYTHPSFEAHISALCDRSAFSTDVDEQVREILDDVECNGDRAVVKYAQKFDNAELSPEDFRLSETAIDAAHAQVSQNFRNAMDIAHANILEFSSQRIPKSWEFSPRTGVVLGEMFQPLQRVMAYIPGGNSALASTVLHTVTLAKAAGVPSIAVTSPPRRDGSVDPAIIAAASLAGATEIYRLGGVYAIGAFAFGTESIRRANKIVGPGNAFVTAAKRMVYGEVSIDLVAGPSEVVILADESVSPAFIAADMLAQAEHGSGQELAVLLTTSEDIRSAVEAELVQQAAQLPNRDLVDHVLRHGTFLAHIESLDQGIHIVNRLAPEHLELLTEDPDALVSRVTTAGAVFLGQWTPESVGDYVAGPSHVLPTGGAGRNFSGLTVDQFVRRVSTIRYNRHALAREAEAIEAFADVEDLPAHGRAVKVRISSDE